MSSRFVECNKCHQKSVLRTSKKWEHDNICWNGVCTGQEIHDKDSNGGTK